jgi:nitric oxide reductase NorE protein
VTLDIAADTDLPEFLGGAPAASQRVRRPQRAAGERRTPGEPGLWVFILGDMSMFGAFFVVLLWHRRAAPAQFEVSAQELMRPIGLINTAVLLLSSYLVVSALWAQRRGGMRRATLSLVGALGCGLVFGVLKVVEYLHILGNGRAAPATDMFYTFYFVLTGVHLLHVLIGVVLLAAWMGVLRKGRAVTRFVEGSAVYWHMVDLLWVVIFTLLYLVCAA